MDINGYRDEIKLELTGGLLDLEIDDANLDLIINASMREIQRYIDTTTIITIPYQKCIDMKPYKVNSVVGIYRSEGYVADDSGSNVVDPMQASQWQLLSGVGNFNNFSNYALNFASWNTLLQIRNTTSTDLAFRYDKPSEKLYINISTASPSTITVEYVPRFDNVEEITSDFWVDKLMKLAIARSKIILGRIRSKFTQTNALWTLDGNTLLEEGTAELNALREQLRISTQLGYPVD